jgi:hypothetical protein
VTHHSATENCASNGTAEVCQSVCASNAIRIECGPSTSSVLHTNVSENPVVRGHDCTLFRRRCIPEGYDSVSMQYVGAGGTHSEEVEELDET